jgi:hypothetical protein
MVGDNAQRLREAGLISDEPLPEAYSGVIDELPQEVVESLITLKQRLDGAGIPTAPLGSMQQIVVL